MELPAQIGELPLATGAEGMAFTMTDNVPAEPVQTFTVAVTEYVPVAAVVADDIVGFCEVEVNPFGPAQL